MVKMSHVGHTPGIDLSKWTMVDYSGSSAIDEIERFVRKAATEVLVEVFKEDPPELCFGGAWGIGEGGDGCGGPAVSDAAMMYVELSLSSSDDYERVVYGLSLEDAVDDVIELYATRLNGKPEKVRDAKGQDICRKIAIRLRELAAKLESACAEGDSTGPSLGGTHGKSIT
jgi:hypothetical protein